MRLSYGVFVARSYPTVVLSLALKETGMLSIFWILNQSVQTLPEPIEIVNKLLPLNVFGKVQTPLRSIDKVQRLIKTRHVKNRELFAGDSPMYWCLDPYNQTKDAIYKMPCNDDMQIILTCLTN